MQDGFIELWRQPIHEFGAETEELVGAIVKEGRPIGHVRVSLGPGTTPAWVRGDLFFIASGGWTKVTEIVPQTPVDREDLVRVVVERLGTLWFQTGVPYGGAPQQPSGPRLVT